MYCPRGLNKGSPVQDTQLTTPGGSGKLAKTYDGGKQRWRRRIRKRRQA